MKVDYDEKTICHKSAYNPLEQRFIKCSHPHVYVFSFRNCLLNTHERRVIKDGKVLDLTTKTFDVLQLLVQHSGEILTKDEMLNSVWNGQFVEEGNLSVQIAKLRRYLD